MSDYVLRSEKITVPSAAGIDGFLTSIKAILRRPRVQKIVVTGLDVVFDFYAKNGEQDLPIEVDFEATKPYNLIRTKPIEEFDEKESPALTLNYMFGLVGRDHLTPICFVASPNTRLWLWARKTGLVLPQHLAEVFGYEVRYDEHIPDDALILAAGISRGSTLIDAHKSYKVQIGGILDVADK